MKSSVAIGAALVLLSATPAFAHRTDEYLQATLISVGKDRVQVQLRLAPGVAVFPSVLAAMDADRNGTVSDDEQRAYVSRVVRDVSLAVDGTPLALRVASWKFASVSAMRDGLGEIEIDVEAAVPSGGVNRRLTFVNHQAGPRAVYLVNALVPRDPDIHITSQSRSYDQSSYQLEYSAAPSPVALGNGARGAPASAGERSMARPAAREWIGYVGMVRLGMRHISGGTDHLLFLLVLLLPAPLAAAAGRWTRQVGVKRSAGRLLRIVTAFTLGHSLTLALAATGWVRAPSGPVEILVAVSILVSAVHALRPIFPGREAYVAGGFGLVHGLAFATMIAGYGIDPWHTALTVLGFNIGIELMQLAIVAATVPSLLLLARTPLYAPLRAMGAIVAGIAALGWIGERAFALANPIGPIVEGAASHGPLLIAALAIAAIVATARERMRGIAARSRLATGCVPPVY